MHFQDWVKAVVVMVGVVATGTARWSAASDGHGHGHPTEGPHHGALIELGREDYHAELVHEDAAETVTVYVLDAGATKAVPVTAKQVALNVRAGGKPQQFLLAAKPQAGDPDGSASAFVATDARLCEALHTHGASGRLSIEIGGKMYVGRVGGHSHPHPRP